MLRSWNVFRLLEFALHPQNAGLYDSYRALLPVPPRFRELSSLFFVVFLVPTEHFEPPLFPELCVVSVGASPFLFCLLELLQFLWLESPSFVVCLCLVGLFLLHHSPVCQVGCVNWSFVVDQQQPPWKEHKVVAWLYLWQQSLELLKTLH